MSERRVPEGCVCNGAGMCAACLVLPELTRVSIADAYGHAMSGQHELAVAVALILIEHRLGQLNTTLKRIADRPGSAIRLNLTATLIGKEDVPVGTSIQVNPKQNDVQFQVAPSDGSGVPPTLAGPLSWTSSSSGVVLEVATDGLSAKGRITSDGLSVVHVSDGVSSDDCQVIATSTAPSPIALNLTATLIPKGA